MADPAPTHQDPAPPAGPPPRKQVDLRTLPPLARAALVAATILVVVGLALTLGGGGGPSAGGLAAAVVAALLAFALTAWRRQHRG